MGDTQKNNGQRQDHGEERHQGDRHDVTGEIVHWPTRFISLISKPHPKFNSSDRSARAFISVFALLR